MEPRRLLHDMFGSRSVYLQLCALGKPEDFSTAFHGNCCGGYQLYTFANARNSTFKTVGPTRPPKPNFGDVSQTSERGRSSVSA